VSPLRVSALVPFIPSGKDYESSRRFFSEVGFEEEWESDGYAGFRNGNARFILQRFDDEAFASNLMIRIDVDDLDGWFREVSERKLEKRYPGFRINPPKEFPWGREVHFIDPAGVCWHVGRGAA
jgi:catechol 2,3-dioxygenase-like lactoylglutathione lyase family enzyme